MKKYILTLLVAVVAFACADDEYDTTFHEYVGINPAPIPKTASEDSDVGMVIPVIFGGNVSNSRAVTVNYTITGGTYGVDYTVVGGSGASGSFTVPAGALAKEAVGKVVIKGVPDFEHEDNVPLTLTLTGADNGVSVGYPYQSTYSFVIADDDCEFEFEGDLDGREMYFDLVDYEEEADVTITHVSGDQYTIERLGATMLADPGFWAESITDAVPAVATIAPDGTITIAAQYAYTTMFNGSPSKYGIKGTGKVNRCDGNITIDYDIYYSDASGNPVPGGLADWGGSIAAYVHDPETGYMTPALFGAVLTPVVEP